MMIIASGAESRTLRTGAEESMGGENYIVRRRSQARIRGVAYAAVVRTEAGVAADTHSEAMDTHIRRIAEAALFAALPMLGATIGATFDERRQLGFTVWRSACRTAGLQLSTLVEFTLQLLPMAVIGLLLGGLAVLAAGALFRGRFTPASLAAHAGCAVTLPAALILCAFLPPVLMLAADAVLATLAAVIMLALLRTPSRIAGMHP
jgi:hypothetical protein